MNAPTRSSEFRLGWKVLLASMLGVMCGASPIPFNTIGFFIGPLNQECGWTLRDISIGITIFGVLASFLAPLFGAMAARALRSPGRGETGQSSIPAVQTPPARPSTPHSWHA